MSKNPARRQFLKQSSLLALSLGIGLNSGCRQPKTAPNIFMFLSDDHGIFDTSCYGNTTAPTPNISRLASEGLCFYNMFTPDAIGPPSRATLYTGLYPHRHGLDRFGGRAKSSIKSLPFYLSELGYEVVLAGKFDIKPESVFPFTHIEKDQAKAFLQQPHESPFCLIVATRDPHAPFSPKSVRQGGIDPDELQLAPYIMDGPKTRKLVAAYYDKIKKMDVELGSFLDIINKSALEQNTICIYTSDNGPALPFAKWTLYDAGVNVPFILKWPGVVTPGRISKALVNFVDVAPTLIEIAGGQVPQGLDGRSFLPVLKYETSSHHKVVYGTHTHQGDANEYPIRSIRSMSFKYINNVKPEHRFSSKITEGGESSSGMNADFCWTEWKKLAESNPLVAQQVKKYQQRPAEEFYDLQNDPFELNNLAGYGEYQKPMRDLRKQLIAWMRAQDDPLVDSI